jgi:hypothetical protein
MTGNQEKLADTNPMNITSQRGLGVMILLLLKVTSPVDGSKECLVVLAEVKSS